ncbi:MAG: agmatinase [Calditrichia bacterium]
MIKPDFIIKNANYEGCTADFSEADLVLIGAGYDGTSSYRPGSRFAPIALRGETILAQEEYSPYFKKDIRDLPIHDLGDVDIPFGNKVEALSRIEAASRYIVENGKRPVFIGGEHLISLPAFKPVFEKHPDIRVIHLDAHLDLIDELFGERESHGTVMRRISELMGKPGRILQLGIRSGSREDYEYAAANTRLIEFTLKGAEKYLEEFSQYPLYLSIDLDVFDPALLPGTGTPEAGGIFFNEFVDFLKQIQSLNIVAADVVELAPHIDPTGNSTVIASKILRETLMALSG